MAAISLSYGASCVNRLHDRRTIQRFLSILTLCRSVARLSRKLFAVMLFGVLLMLPAVYLWEVM